MKKPQKVAFRGATFLLRARCPCAASLVLEVNISGCALGFEAPGEVGERQTLVLCQRGEVEVLGAEEEQRVEQHYG